MIGKEENESNYVRNLCMIRQGTLMLGGNKLNLILVCCNGISCDEIDMNIIIYIIFGHVTLRSF